MVDSRGGFILPELYPKGLMADELSRIKPVEKTLLEDLPIPLDRDLAPKCRECGSLDVDPLFFKIFTLTVCPACKQAHPEKYSLITKTEAKQDYLLTDEELRDAAILPHWEKPNPRKSTWNNMMLYVREQVELYAFKRWGGEAELDKEFERREEEKKQRKAKKFKANLRDLRNRTRTSLWQRRDFDAKHVHEYGELVENPETGETEKTCQTCGLTIVVTEL
ncbi:DNA repair protein rad14 [Dimargaris verticillata]|uniref:DNA repair protein rad14 n=1 Tax=Dimargaris verticillata TaxID=2761393 RepID=A0A9W8B7U2_9FUNG|nr:DNA repair protein rad14 [Dimargaris verticillata]